MTPVGSPGMSEERLKAENELFEKMDKGWRVLSQETKGVGELPDSSAAQKLISARET